MFTPSTNLRLLNVSLESGYTDTLWFPDVATQTNYFLGKVVRQINDFNFIKKDNTITVNGNVESFYNCNYIMYQNANFSNKWFYAFIDRVEWASNSSTRLYCSTDAIQSWFFDITYYQSFIERQHSTTDEAGDNIVPEPFSVPIVKFNDDSSSILMDLTPDAICILATCDVNGNGISGSKVNGIYTGAALVVSGATPESANTYLQDYVNKGLASAIARIQQIPNSLVSESVGKFKPKRPSTLDGYTPKNKKLLTGLFVRDSINAYGQQIKLDPELVIGSNVVVTTSASVSTGEIATTVTSYGCALSGEQTLVVHIPEATWAYNQYKNDFNLHSGSNGLLFERLNQQRNIEATATLGDTIATAANYMGSIAGSLASGNIAKGAASAAGAVNIARQAGKVAQYVGGFDEITQTIQSIYESYDAPSVGGVASSSPFITGDFTSLVFGYITPPANIAKMYDDYFTIFGYQQNSYGIPNLHARKSWTYVKVPNLKASGDFPDDDFTDIRGAFKNGITFWDYTKTFGDYSQDNTL